MLMKNDSTWSETYIHYKDDGRSVGDLERQVTIPPVEDTRDHHIVSPYAVGSSWWCEDSSNPIEHQGNTCIPFSSEGTAYFPNCTFAAAYPFGSYISSMTLECPRVRWDYGDKLSGGSAHNDCKFSYRTDGSNTVALITPKCWGSSNAYSYYKNNQNYQMISRMNQTFLDAGLQDELAGFGVMNRTAGYHSNLTEYSAYAVIFVWSVPHTGEVPAWSAPFQMENYSLWVNYSTSTSHSAEPSQLQIPMSVVKVIDTASPTASSFSKYRWTVCLLKSTNAVSGLPGNVYWWGMPSIAVNYSKTYEMECQMEMGVMAAGFCGRHTLVS